MAYPSSNNIGAIDFLKFIMSLLVVGIHTHVTSIISSGIIKDAADFILGLAVPYFFICSGYFLYKYVNDSSIFDKDGLVKYLLKIVRLYIVWTLIFLPSTIYCYIYDGLNAKQAIFAFIRGLLLIGEHTYSWPLWYLLAVIVAVGIIYILRALKVKIKWIFVISVIFYLLGVAIKHFHSTIDDYIIGEMYFKLFINTRNGLFLGLFYITLGLMAHRYKISNRSITLYFLGVISGIICSLIGANWIGFPIASFSLFSIALQSPSNNLISKYSVQFRKMSTIIYLLHMTILAPIYIAGININNGLLFICTLSILLPISYFLSKHSDNWGYRLLF